MPNKEWSAPCEGCGAHKHIEKSMEELAEQNELEHQEIMSKLEIAIVNIHWMNIIGRWILGVLATTIIGSLWFIINGTATENKRIDEVIHQVKEGEILHYHNENNIAAMKESLDFIKEKLLKDK